jgi:hypothetical protein
MLIDQLDASSQPLPRVPTPALSPAPMPTASGSAQGLETTEYDELASAASEARARRRAIRHAKAAKKGKKPIFKAPSAGKPFKGSGSAGKTRREVRLSILLTVCPLSSYSNYFSEVEFCLRRTRVCVTKGHILSQFLLSCFL